MKLVVWLCIVIALIVAGIWGLATYEAHRATVRLATAVQTASLGQTAATFNVGVLILVGVILLGLVIAGYGYWRWIVLPQRDSRWQAQRTSPANAWGIGESTPGNALLLQQLQQQTILQTLMMALLSGRQTPISALPSQDTDDNAPLLPEGW